MPVTPCTTTRATPTPRTPTARRRTSSAPIGTRSARPGRRRRPRRAVKVVRAMRPEPATTRSHSGAVTVARYVGALSLIATGALHLQQYYAVYYRVIPVIGPLFLVNFALGVALGLTLLAPLQHRAPELHRLAAIGGIVLAAGTIIGLAISEHDTLFGFHEHGYRPAIVMSLAVEALAIVSLAAYLIASRPLHTHAVASPA